MFLYNRINHSKVENDWLRELFTKLGISKLSDKYPSELSGGERQRGSNRLKLYIIVLMLSLLMNQQQVWTRNMPLKSSNS
jgi:ABC-type nitrate/sulfonate/bicarbonate transport system ATPase subunit